MEVHRLNNLNFAAPPGKRLVVLGDPISHSLSPFMHNAALAEMSIEHPEMADWRYEAVHVPAVDLPAALPILHEAGVVGINLTIPHKVQVLKIIDEMDMTAKRMGAVNTLIRTDTGYRGSNTDGYGILKGLEEALNREVGGSDVWLFGAGGAARGILVACLEGGVGRLTVVNRSSERLEELKSDLSEQKLSGFEEIRFCSQEENPSDPKEDAILINATSLGLNATDPNPVGIDLLKPGMGVYDTTYGTSNQLANDCQRLGVGYADGLSMLVWQGVRSLEIWTNKSVCANRMREAAELELKNRTYDG